MPNTTKLMGDPFKILVVDDELHILELLSRFFSRRGYEISAARSLQEAKHCLELNQYSLIILDVLFPDGNGLNFLDDVRIKYPSIPVIIMTGIGNDEGLLRECVERGAAGYVSKLLPLNQLLMEVHRHLDFSKAGA